VVIRRLLMIVFVLYCLSSLLADHLESIKLSHSVTCTGNDKQTRKR